MSTDRLARAAADAMWAQDTASRALGMAITEIAPGAATLTMPVSDTMVNGHGLCHGGYIFMLADSAFAFACNS
ncbi:MAG: hotdog fold thioesterase, partial [Hyphomicrobiales bacterium]|nr:hotdog fold thioesterase [Hyphomicrobiales bacterium]